MKKALLIIALAVFASFVFASINGGYVLFDDNSGSTFSYLTPGAGMTGESDTSNLIVLPQDIEYIVWWPVVDSGAADADADSLCFKIYGIDPHGVYHFCDTIGDGIGGGGDWADAAVDSSGNAYLYSDTCWHYMTVYTDSAAASPTPIHVDGLGWSDQYVGFRIIFSCTDTTDLGASLMYTYTTYGFGKIPSY